MAIETPLTTKPCKEGIQNMETLEEYISNKDAREMQLDATNDAEREKVKQFANGRTVYIAQVNAWNAGEVGLKEYDGSEILLNFSCSFAVPFYDSELQSLLEEHARYNFPNWYIAMPGANPPPPRTPNILIPAIYQCAEALGGIFLYWA